MTLAPVGQNVVAFLEDELPSVSVFVGPRSVGKWTTALYLADLHGIAPEDRFLEQGLTTYSQAARLERFAQFPPLGSQKLAVVRLKGPGEGAYASLLKSLEEPPEWMHYVITMTHLPGDTLLSRATLFDFNRLAISEVSEVLQRVKKMSQGQADVMAHRSNGQIMTALSYGRINEHKPAVSLVVKAFREKDPDVLERVAKQWTDEHTDLLTSWCYESLSGRWKIFSLEESGVLPEKIPLRILIALRTRTRPRLLIRSVLMDVLKEMM